MQDSTLAERVAYSAPVAYFGTVLLNWPWPAIASMLAALWTFGLMWKAWLWQPFIKPWLAKRRAR